MGLASMLTRKAVFHCMRAVWLRVREQPRVGLTLLNTTCGWPSGHLYEDELVC